MVWAIPDAMLAGTLVTVISLPFYALGFRLWGLAGWCRLRSRISLHTLSLLVLLPRRLPDATAPA